MDISISRQLNYYLRLRNMSVNQLSDKSGVSYAYLNDLVNGKKENPGFKQLKKIAYAFEIEVSQFVTPVDNHERVVLLVERIERLPKEKRDVIENMVDALEVKN